MSTLTRREYFRLLRERYQAAASKLERSRLLDEAVIYTALHRKSVIRAMNQAEPSEPRKSGLGRPRKYCNPCIEWLKRLYRLSDYACSDKLKRMLPTLLGQWKGPVDVRIHEELLSMSPASIDRYLRQYRGIERRRFNTRTRPGSIAYKRLVPLKSLDNKAPRPGYLQGDTVSHGGESTAGEYIWSLTATDEKAGWTENRAFFGKHAKTTLPALQSVHERLPFDLVSFNFDNGSEFMNARVIEYYEYLAREKVIPFPMTRSRSYRKNDNCHVEQKNWTSVRQLFGYDRLEDKELVPLMNEIYRVQNLISNYFVPQFKLRSKVRIGAKVKKTYDEPKTPYERLLEDPDVTDEQKRKLRETYTKLNYFDLLREREELLARFEQLKRELKSKKSRVNPSDPLPTASQ
jgi:hypothetical protein